jgi:hypothetical protein
MIQMVEVRLMRALLVWSCIASVVSGANELTITGTSNCEGDIGIGVDDTWDHVGFTADGHPYYENDVQLAGLINIEHTYLYFEPACNRWVFGIGKPSETARSDLDDDGKCPSQVDFPASYAVATGDTWNPPSGKYMLKCFVAEVYLENLPLMFAGLCDDTPDEDNDGFEFAKPDCAPYPDWIETETTITGGVPPAPPAPPPCPTSCSQGKFLSGTACCVACPPGQYQVDHDFEGDKCTTGGCAAGEFYTYKGPTLIPWCTKCPPDTFQPDGKASDTSCDTYKTCGAGTYFKRNPTDPQKKDATCPSCAGNTYQPKSDHNSPSCIDQPICGTNMQLVGARSDKEGTCTCKEGAELQGDKCVVSTVATTTTTNNTAATTTNRPGTRDDITTAITALTTAPAEVNASTDDAVKKQGLSTGVIVAIACCVLLVGAIPLIIIMLRKKRHALAPPPPPLADAAAQPAAAVFINPHFNPNPILINPNPNPNPNPDPNQDPNANPNPNADANNIPPNTKVYDRVAVADSEVYSACSVVSKCCALGDVNILRSHAQ